MEIKRIKTTKEEYQDVVYTYGAFGYQFIDKLEKPSGRVILNFQRNHFIPRLKILKQLERRYKNLVAHKFYYGWIYLVIAITMAILTFIFHANFLFYIFLISGIIFITFFIFNLISSVASLTHFQVEKKKIVQSGYEIQNKIIILPKDANVYSNGLHHQKIRSYYKSKNGV